MAAVVVVGATVVVVVLEVGDVAVANVVGASAARTSGGESCVHPLTSAHRPATANQLRTPPEWHQ
jgi:hypothetical protein